MLCRWHHGFYLPQGSCLNAWAPMRFLIRWWRTLFNEFFLDLVLVPLSDLGIRRRA